MHKFLPCLLTLLGLSHLVNAQSSTVSSTLTSSDPIIPSSQLVQDGIYPTCGMSKAYPGSLASGGVHYRGFFLSAPASTTCVPITYAPTCSQGTGLNTFLAVYSGTFDPTNLATNYVGDIAASVGDGATTNFSVNVPAGANYILIVSGTTSTTECSNYSITVSGVTVMAQPLPVELVSFTGQATPLGNALRWATASELNNAGFVVERSATGEQYATLGQVAGAGSSAQAHSYAYLDAAPLPGLNYYRLRQRDTDGSEHFSPVVTVQSSAGVLSFAPNPVTDQVTFTSPVATTLMVHDALGRVVRTLPLAAGSQQVSLATLPAGVYWLTDGATHHATRLVRAAN